MSLSLENPFLQFTSNLRAGTWSLYSRQLSQTYFENVRIAVSYRLPNARFTATHPFQAAGESETAEAHSVHGRLKQITLVDQSSNEELKFSLTFALPEQAPYLLWQLNIENVGRLPVRIEQIELLSLVQKDAQDRTDPARFSFGSSFQSSPALAFFSNGWQSWNFSGAYGPNDRFRATRLGPFTSPMRVSSGRPRPKAAGHLVSDMFAVLGDRQQRLGALTGFLSQQQHFGTIETHLMGQDTDLRLWANGDSARLDPGQQIATDWAYISFINLDETDPLAAYFEAVARHHHLLPPFPNETPVDPNYSWPSAPTGWCSWYDFYGHVTATDIRANLQTAIQLADQLPLQVIQIDDGFETKVGDWHSFKPTFPDGMAALARDIRTAGFTPGLWLAPFTVVPSSRVAADHPDWLLRGRFNLPVNAGYNSWGEFSTALDLTCPEALHYAQEVVQIAAHQWGFSYLKLDFLYAGALPGKHLDPTRTRAQILRNGLKALREGLDKEIMLVGCGCPLGSAIGLVDTMRIGADVSPRWKPAYAGVEFFFEAEPDYPSTRNALQNILTRAGMHRRWWINDPDCVLLRPETHLSLAELQSLATAIALTGGSLFLSDNLPLLPEERIRIAASLLPPLPGRAQVIDWFDSVTPTRLRLDLHSPIGEWSLLALFNWDDHPQDLSFEPAAFGLLDRQAYWVHEYWRNETHYLPPRAGSRLSLEDTDPHGVRLLAVRPAQVNRPCYLGGSLHISQGLEVTGWENTPGQLKLNLTRPARCQGEIRIYIPDAPLRLATLNGEPLSWQPGKDGQYSFHLDFPETADLQLAF